MRDAIIAALRTVKDPEIPVNLYDLGLIYEIDIAEDSGAVAITMTLTTPNCPVAESIPAMVKTAAEGVAGVTSVDVSLVWDPPWNGEMMSEDAKAALDMMGIAWNDPRSGPSATSLTIGKTGRPGAPRPDRR